MHIAYNIYVHLHSVIMNPYVSVQLPAVAYSFTRNVPCSPLLVDPLLPVTGGKYYKAFVFRSYARLFVIVIAGDFETWIIIYIHAETAAERVQVSRGLLKRPYH
jgi:hypothetical protein